MDERRKGSAGFDINKNCKQSRLRTIEKRTKKKMEKKRDRKVLGR